MDLKKLDTLREKMVNGEEFADAMIYFMDHFGDSREFIALGKLGHDKLVEQGVKNILNEALHREVRVSRIVLVELPGKGFAHGSFMADRGFGNFFYYKEINMGMVAAQFPEMKGETIFARFTAFAVSKPSDPSSN